MRDALKSEMIGPGGQGKRIKVEGAIILSPQRRRVRKVKITGQLANDFTVLHLPCQFVGLSPGGGGVTSVFPSALCRFFLLLFFLQVFHGLVHRIKLKLPDKEDRLLCLILCIIL